MNFDISALDADFADGLRLLQADFKFGINGTVKLTAEHGKAGVRRADGGFVISYDKKCEFYRGFAKLLAGEIGYSEKCSFKYLGAMIDCSRNAVMTVDAVKSLIRRFAVIGFDTLELYTEDTYEIDGEPYFGYLRGRYTVADLKELDEYGAKFGVELTPCIQTLAHLNGIARWDRFKPIIDCDDILLADDEGTYALIEKMFKTLAECFRSRRIHIGMDEAHKLGLGKYLDKNGYSNRFEIMSKHLKRVLEIADKYGYSCTMWSDMFFRLLNKGCYYPVDGEISQAVLDMIPKNITLTYWDYYHNDSAYYAKMFAAHKVMSDRISFAGGAWRWNTFTPSNTMSINRNKLALENCVKHGVDDVLITVWGDDGVECPTFALLPTLVAAAEQSYGNADYKKAFKTAVGAEWDDFMTLELADDSLCGKKGNFIGGNMTKMFLYNDLLSGVVDYAARPEYYERLKTAAEKTRAAAKRVGKFSYMFDSTAALVELVAQKYDFGVRARKAYKAGDKTELKALADKITELVKLVNKFYKSFRACWNSENKPQGFEVQDIRIGGLR
ncbi:MAG: beta-N-acetylhexosaminidase, partial [Clostridiales bacterium]|nr:beta-N-acetylhexosaminidase [Clostridiales bacterium]